MLKYYQLTEDKIEKAEMGETDHKNTTLELKMSSYIEKENNEKPTA